MTEVEPRLKPDYEPCVVEGCQRPRSPKAGKQMCSLHYGRVRRNGHPGPSGVILDLSLTPEQRFWAKVDQRSEQECWPWLAQRTPNGYGRFWAGPSAGTLAHRVAYEWLVGPIPDGLQLDHLCRVRHCVNPAHLEPVTNAENQRRGFGPPGLHHRATHCKRGHEFTPENTYRRPSKSSVRECRACLLERNRRYERQKRGAA